jgi:elongation factor 1-alpha
MDKIKYDEERFIEIKSELLKFMKQIGFKNENLYFIPLSGYIGFFLFFLFFFKGDNLIKNSENLNWFKGNFLF